jgi:ATP-binding cassette subfamily B protein
MIEGKHTVFIIAHRISSIKEADLILVIEDGRIVESGNHDSLLGEKGYYHTVFHHQYGDFDQFYNREDSVTKYSSSTIKNTLVEHGMGE